MDVFSYVTAWRQEGVDEWKRKVIVPLHQDKGSKNECNNSRGYDYLVCQEKYLGWESLD